MRLLVDMNLTPRWVGWLASSGIEAIHWSDIGPGNATDREIMAHARANGLILMTQDLDFGAILAVTQGAGPSVVQIRADIAIPETVGNAVVDALRQMADDIERGALLSIEPSRTRLRLLPLPKEG